MWTRAIVVLAGVLTAATVQAQTCPVRTDTIVVPAA